jgi:hypothetical protein
MEHTVSFLQGIRGRKFRAPPSLRTDHRDPPDRIAQPGPVHDPPMWSRPVTSTASTSCEHRTEIGTTAGQCAGLSEILFAP